MGIYLVGAKKFADIPSEYVMPVKKYAASTYETQVINLSHEKGFITDDEWTETLNLKYPDGIPDGATTLSIKTDLQQ